MKLRTRVFDLEQQNRILSLLFQQRVKMTSTPVSQVKKTPQKPTCSLFTAGPMVSTRALMMLPVVVLQRGVGRYVSGPVPLLPLVSCSGGCRF